MTFAMGADPNHAQAVSIAQTASLRIDRLADNVANDTTADPVAHTAPAVKSLRENGIAIIPSVFSVGQCRDFVRRLESLAADYNTRGLTDLGADVHSVWNFFRHDLDLLPLIHNPVMDGILRQVIDGDYVLIAANAINRTVKVDNPRKRAEGDNWHTDSRYVGGRRLDWGFNYSMCVMLEPFTENNAATQFVPRSHLDRSTPDRMGDYPHQTITGDAGTMVIFDSGLWHRGGPPSRQSRWGVFNMYGPWFMKPYYRFDEMLPDQRQNLSADLRRLLHMDSTPPLNEEHGFSTLARVRAREMPVAPSPSPAGLGRKEDQKT